MSVRENNRLLSIIVPVYNAEKYLDHCVGSILEQTYRDLELILVDDGSEDDSARLCDAWAKKDKRVVVCHIPNGGPSHARNYGLHVANGRFIAFVDADDFLNSKMYEKLIASMLDKKCDMAICRWVLHDLDTGTTELAEIGAPALLEAAKLKEIIVSDEIAGGGGYPWNRVIDWNAVSARMEHKIEFREDLRVYEDKIWILEVLDQMNQVALVDYVGYHYEVHKTSLSHRSYAGRVRDMLVAWKIMEECFGGKLPEKASMFRAFWTFTYFWKIKKEKKYFLIKELWSEQRNIAKKVLKWNDVRKIVQFVILDLISIFYIGKYKGNKCH